MRACIFLLLYSQLCVFTFARSPSSLLPVHQARASLQYTHPTDRCKHASGSLSHSMARKLNAVVLSQTDTAVHPTLGEGREISFSLKNTELIHTLIHYPALTCFNHLRRTFCQALHCGIASATHRRAQAARMDEVTKPQNRCQISLPLCLSN